MTVISAFFDTDSNNLNSAESIIGEATHAINDTIRLAYGLGKITNITIQASSVPSRFEVQTTVEANQEGT